MAKDATHRTTQNQGAQLSRERIVEVALRLSDSDAALEKLTVRRLASELGVGTMTLYSYFRSKDEILDAMADHVLGDVRMESMPDEGPAEALRGVAEAFLRMMREHPTVVRLFSQRVTDSHTALHGGMEGVLERLVKAGLPGPVAVRSYSFLITFALGFVSYQLPRPWARGDDDASVEARRQRRHVYAGLPIDDFPVMVDLAEELVDLPADKQFWTGVDAFIDSTLRELGDGAAQG
jgi:AcrR family transcriptional regulator